MSTLLDAVLALEFDEVQPLPAWKPGDPLIEPSDSPTVYALTLTYAEMDGIAVPGKCERCGAEEYVDRDVLCADCRGAS